MDLIGLLGLLIGLLGLLASAASLIVAALQTKRLADIRRMQGDYLWTLLADTRRVIGLLEGSVPIKQRDPQVYQAYGKIVTIYLSAIKTGRAEPYQMSSPQTE